MSDNPVQKAGINDRDRCEAVTAAGQCQNKSVPNLNPPRCPLHQGGLAQKQKIETNRVYHLKKWRERVGQLADHPSLKSLKEEIGILRMMLESCLNMCDSANDLEVRSNQIGSLIDKIEKLVVSCHKLEEKTGVLLDINTVSQIVDVILTAVNNHVEDAEVLAFLSEEIPAQLCQVLGISSLNGSQQASNGPASTTPQGGQPNIA